MGDGSVRFIPGDIDPKLLLAMATRAGGEDFVADRSTRKPRWSIPPKKQGRRAEDRADTPADAEGRPEVAPAPREPKK